MGIISGFRVCSLFLFCPHLNYGRRLRDRAVRVQMKRNRPNEWVTLELRTSQITLHKIHLDIPWKCRFWFRSSGVKLRSCIFNKLQRGTQGQPSEMWSRASIPKPSTRITISEIQGTVERPKCGKGAWALCRGLFLSPTTNRTSHLACLVFLIQQLTEVPFSLLKKKYSIYLKWQQ